MAEMVVDMVRSMRETLITNAQKLVTQGRWNKIDVDRLVDRIPTEKEASFGADAGIFAALGMIPEQFVTAITKLHAGVYNVDMIETMRKEYRQIKEGNGVQNATLYWLLAGSLCEEGGVTQARFTKQVSDFGTLVEGLNSNDATAISGVKNTAINEFDSLTRSFSLYGNVPIGTDSGAIHGAYLAGYPYGTYLNADFGLFFIGTYRESMGLEDFQFNTATQKVNGRDLPMSGPVVEGNYQFVKCSDIHEFSRAIDTVQKTLL